MGKIIIVNRFFYPDLSATSQMASGLAFALAKSGKQVCIVTSPLSYENPQERLPKKENVMGVEIHRVWTTRFGRANLAGRALDYLSFYITSFYAILTLASAKDIVIAKTDPPLISVVAWIATQIKRARLVNWIQDLFPEVAVALGVIRLKPGIAILRWLRNLSLKGASMNVSIGTVMHKKLLGMGLKPDTTTIIHNWADGNLIRPVAHSANTLRNLWGIQDKLVVGYSGNMGRAHDFETIIQAIVLLKNSSDIVFLFIGGGASKQKLENAFRENGVQNYIFKPYQTEEHLAESLSAADVHLVSLLPQLEGLIVPSKIYGITAAGRPVIFVGDPEGEIGRIIDANGFGIKIPRGEGMAMANTIQHFSNHQDIINSMGQTGRECFEQQYDMPRAIQKWLELLESVSK